MREMPSGCNAYVVASKLAAVTLLLSTISAAEAQSSMPDVREQAWAVLTSGLRHHHASNRAAAVQALELMTRNRRAAQFAIRALRDKDFHVRAAAAVSLGPMEAKEAKSALHDALNDQEVSVALAATHSLYLLKDKRAFEIYYAILMGDRKSSNGLIQSQLDRLKDPKQMMQMGFEEGISFVPFGGMGYGAWQELHRHDGANARAVAAGFLAHDPDQITEDALIQTALADKNEEVRIAAVDALAQRGDPNCIERLAKNLTEDKSAVQYRTAAAILHLSDMGKQSKK